MSAQDEVRLAESLPEPKDFTESLAAIAELEKALSCDRCEKLMKDPVTLWSCDHVFCKRCTENMNSCYVCSLPSWAEDRRVNKAITNVSKLTARLKELLEGYMAETNQIPRSKHKSSEIEENQTRSESLQGHNTEVANAMDHDILRSATISNKPLNIAQKKPKFKITPKRPFPEVIKEESRTTESNSHSNSEYSDLDATRITEIEADSSKLLSQNLSKKDIHEFATPSPPKRKQASRTPSTLKNAGRRLSIPQKSPGVRTPKTPKSAKKNKKGETLLHIAAIKNNIDDLKMLVLDGADVNVKDNAGWTPLHEACNHGHIDIVRELLDSGALVNIPGYDDETPLMDAVLNGHTDIVKLLLERGADASLRKSNGLTARDLAKKEDIINILDEHQCLTQSAMDAFNAETGTFGECAPQNIVISYSSNINGEKMKKCAEILSARLDPKDVITGLDACIDAGSWVSERGFEILGSKEDMIDSGPKRARLNKAAQCPAIFHGCHFYLHGYFKSPSPTKQQLNKLLHLAGGTLLTREPKPDSDRVQTCTKVPYHAHKDSAQYYYTYYIVYNSAHGKPSRLVRQGKVCSVPLSWILDCISQFYLCEIPEFE